MKKYVIHIFSPEQNIGTFNTKREAKNFAKTIKRKHKIIHTEIKFGKPKIV